MKEFVRGEPRIICAAVQFKNGLIIPSARHLDPTMHTVMKHLHPDPTTRRKKYSECIQGFIDQFGKFYNRKEARIIAEKMEQLVPGCSSGSDLYSEDLY